MTEEQIKAMIAASLAEGGFLTKAEFNSTAAMIRKLSTGNEEISSILAGLVTKNEDGTYALKAAATPAAKSDGKPDPMAEINALKAELKKRDDALATERKSAADTAKKLAIQAALTKNGAVNPGRDAVHIFDSVKQDSNGDYVVFGKDANGLDTVTSLDVHVGGWLKSNPELVRAQSKTGSGTPVSAGSTPGSVKLSDMSMSDYAAKRNDILAGKITLE
jgi:hypothetical protein